MATTLYNHNSLGTADKPLIPNIEFKNLIAQIESGNKEALPLVLEKYTLEHFQKQLAERLQNKNL